VGKNDQQAEANRSKVWFVAGNVGIPTDPPLSGPPNEPEGEPATKKKKKEGSASKKMLKESGGLKLVGWAVELKTKVWMGFEKVRLNWLTRGITTRTM